MNLTDLTNYVTTKGQMVGTADLAAAKLFLSKRYELIYNSYLWKDSLVMVDVAFDPSDANNAEGVVLLPAVIDRVVGIRTSTSSVKVRGLEDLYRVDYDWFQAQGEAREFVLLSPVWLIWRGAYGLKLVSSAATDDGKVVRVVWWDTAGVRHVESLTLNSASPPTLTPDTTLSTVDENVMVVTDAGTAAANQIYVKNGTLNGRTLYRSQDELATIYWTGTVWRLNGTTGHTSYRYETSDAPDRPDQGTWVVAAVNPGTAPVPTVTCPGQVKITLEAVFKPTTSGTLTFESQLADLGAGKASIDDGTAGTLSAATLRSPSYQRVRLVSIPSVATTLNVLGKKTFVPLDFDQQEPDLKNLDNCLIAFALGDLWHRSRQLGKAQACYTEGTQLLQELAKLETVQAANHQRFVPDNGAGDPFFSPNSQRGLWI